MEDSSKLIQGRVLPFLSETYLHDTSVRSQIIYSSVILFLTAAFLSLPFINVSINIKSLALIRPSTEVSMIRSLVNGRIKESYIQENKAVRQGDVLFTIESDLLTEKEKYLQTKAVDAQNLIKDLHTLLKTESTLNPELSTSLYQQAWFNYKQRIIEAQAHYKKAVVDYNRNAKLHQQAVIADVEFEGFKFAMDKTKNELSLLTQSQLNQWQGELQNLNKELADLTTQLSQLEEEKQNLSVTAPVSGTIQNLKGIYPGSTVFMGQDVASISPDTNLIAEAYITPNDIGLIRKNMPVRFQVEAFNYNQWGLATGNVIDIPNDIQVVNDHPVFKVKCSLHKDYLQLKNGYKGYLKKGMTLQARFMITERSLWQLLFDKVDDWINPNLSRKSS